jgi:predicted acylesterase/phospholipase RssA
MAALLFAAALCGCLYEHRDPRTRQELFQARDKLDQRTEAASRAIVDRILHRAKSDYDDYTAGRRTQPPVFDILIISGGGDWGAFGAGFLKGWGKVPRDHPLAKPDFTVVTGVSTGALIAPFAFLNTDESIDRIGNLYRNPKPDWVKQRGVLYFLPSHISFAEIPGLERELRVQVTPDMIKKIAEKGADGHALVVNTSSVDDGTPYAFDLVDEAQRAVESGSLDRIYTILLASAGIPAAFPFRIVDNHMLVDGGVTGNIIYGGRIDEEDSIAATWQKTYPNLTIPKVRYWVIFNNQARPQPQVTEPNWPAVMQRSLEMGTRSATLTAIRHLHAMAEISRLKRHADAEVRLVAIPTEWTPPKPGVFIKETMNNLADLGEKMGADPKSWSTDVPP